MFNPSKTNMKKKSNYLKEDAFDEGIDCWRECFPIFFVQTYPFEAPKEYSSLAKYREEI